MFLLLFVVVVIKLIINYANLPADSPLSRSHTIEIATLDFCTTLFVYRINYVGVTLIA